MHDLATRVMTEIASARAAVAASYLRLWNGLDREAPAASGGPQRDQGEAARDTRTEPDQTEST